MLTVLPTSVTTPATITITSDNWLVDVYWNIASPGSWITASSYNGGSNAVVTIDATLPGTIHVTSYVSNITVTVTPTPPYRMAYNNGVVNRGVAGAASSSSALGPVSIGCSGTIYHQMTAGSTLILSQTVIGQTYRGFVGETLLPPTLDFSGGSISGGVNLASFGSINFTGPSIPNAAFDSKTQSGRMDLFIAENVPAVRPTASVTGIATAVSSSNDQINVSVGIGMLEIVPARPGYTIVGVSASITQANMGVFVFEVYESGIPPAAGSGYTLDSTWAISAFPWGGDSIGQYIFNPPQGPLSTSFGFSPSAFSLLGILLPGSTLLCGVTTPTGNASLSSGTKTTFYVNGTAIV